MPLSPTVAVFIATSLDGYIARPDGTLDWLPPIPETGDDYGYHAFMADVDALVMGRNTYEVILSFGPWPYAGKRVVVLSTSQPPVPAELATAVEVTAAAPEALLARLAAEGVRKVYLDGGRTIQGFLAAGLVDELIVSRVPVLLGAGIPLFGPLEHDIALDHLTTKAHPSGLVQSRYRVRR